MAQDPDMKSSHRGFAAMDQNKQREIASKGGAAVPNAKRSFSQNRELAAAAGRKGGQASGGNFANNPQRASEAGRKGGHASGGNFANNPRRAAEAGRKGGHASSGINNPRRKVSNGSESDSF
jgi:general stress protein YciG